MRAGDILFATSVIPREVSMCHSQLIPEYHGAAFNSWRPLESQCTVVECSPVQPWWLDEWIRARGNLCNWTQRSSTIYIDCSYTDSVDRIWNKTWQRASSSNWNFRQSTPLAILALTVWICDGHARRVRLIPHLCARAIVSEDIKSHDRATVQIRQFPSQRNRCGRGRWYVMQNLRNYRGNSTRVPLDPRAVPASESCMSAELEAILSSTSKA